MPAAIDLTGKRFGRLLVMLSAGRTIQGSRSVRMWQCRCDCGRTLDVSRMNLTSGDTRSCGCLRVDSPNSRTHGHSRVGIRTHEYNTWAAMVQRCTNPKTPNYQYYGARGIKVCDRWRDSFENFLADMGERPPGTSIDRRNNELGYEPGNCRWATKREQMRNTRHNKLTDALVLEIHGRCEHGESQSSVARRLGINREMVSSVRRGHSWPELLGH